MFRYKLNISITKTISWCITILLFLLIWIFLSNITSTGQYIPKLSKVFLTINEFWSILLKHTGSTLKSAFGGFVLGLFFAIISTLIVVLWRRSKEFFSFFSLIIYSIPLIAAAPIAALLFEAKNAGIVLGCIGSYLPIFLSGIKYGDQVANKYHNVVKGLGASKISEFKLIKLPLIIRGWFIGSESGWMWAVLGALLGDFTGSRWGLGTFLIGSLVQGESSKIWVIVFLCLFISLLGLLIIKLLRSFFMVKAAHDTVEYYTINVPRESLGKSISNKVYIFLILILSWQGLSWLVNIEGGVFSSPLDMFTLTKDILNNNSSLSMSFLFEQLLNTWTLSIIGIMVSLLIAFLLASGKFLFPFLSRPIVLIMLITQVTPIVAFIPLIAFYLERGAASIITIVVLSTIYSSYIVFLRALEDVPLNAINIVRGFGARNLILFVKVRLPYATWMILVALRLAIGRAILGAITAEYLLTGTGLGGILGNTRALLDFRIVWYVCLIVAIATLITDRLFLGMNNFMKNLIMKSEYATQKSSTLSGRTS